VDQSRHTPAVQAGPLSAKAERPVLRPEALRENEAFQVTFIEVAQTATRTIQQEKKDGILFASIGE
jgi:hypothetical protein